GSARGEGRSVKAAETAINSPLLEASMDGAHGVLLSIAGGSDLGLFEINEAASLVQEAAHIEANIIFGTVIDDSLGDEVRVTVIAAGFDGGGPSRRSLESTAAPTSRTGANPIGSGRAGEIGQGRAPEAPARPTEPATAGVSGGRAAAPNYRDTERYRESERQRVTERALNQVNNSEPRDDGDDDDDIEVPIFMRR
ncbi:MAG: cell division protein FtsZ, partial [Nocardia sp.]|nr:cell division protein FtsZ [Nocardia sp.]